MEKWRKFFGKLDYQPPEWFKVLWGKLCASPLGLKSSAFKKKIQENPKRSLRIFLSILAGITVAVVGMIHLKNYYDSLPKPAYVTFRIDEPRPTDPVRLIPDSLTINFEDSAAQLDDLNKVITKGIRITPEIIGSWRWTSDRTLKFTPVGPQQAKGDWKIGTEYKVSFEKSLFPSHVLLKEYGFSFETDQLSLRISKQEFYVDPMDPNIKRVVVNLYSNYPIDSESVKKHVKFSLSDKDGISVSKDVSFQVGFNALLTEIYLQSDPLAVPKKDELMKVKIEKGILSKNKEGETKKDENAEVDIPSLYNAFKISGSDANFARNEKFEPEQILSIQTSVDASSEELSKHLKVYQLPTDRPADGDVKEIKDYRWNSVSELTDKIKKAMTPVELKLIPSEFANSKMHTFKVQVAPEHTLYIIIKKGLKAIGGYELQYDDERLQYVENFPHELSFMGDGAILSLSGDLKLPLLGRNLNEVEYEIMRVIPEQVNHLMRPLSETDQDIRRNYLDEYLRNSIAQRFQVKQDLHLKSPAATQYFALDLEPYVNKSGNSKGVFIIKAIGKARNHEEKIRDERLILITDIGILLKETVAHHREVYVQNFRTGLPIEGALVEVIGANGLPIMSINTDANGHVTLPDLKDFKHEKQPIAVVARKAEDTSYLPLNNYSRALQYSRFDIGGVYETSSSDELKAMLFSDRGLYRPGEKVSLGGIVRSKSGKRDFKKLPVTWTVTDPRGNEILNQLIEVSASDLKSLEFNTEYTSPTGVYTVNMFLMNKNNYREHIGELTVRVEEFMPDRLRLKTTLSQEKLLGWIKPDVIKANINLQNLFGTPAEARRVIGRYTLTPTFPNFPSYKDYIFTNPNRPDLENYSETLNEAETDEKGLAEFEIDLKKYNGSLYHMRFDAEAFESEGGRSVLAASNVLVSPLSFLIGAKPDGDLTYIKKGSERNIDLIAIDSDLKKVAADNLEVEISERKYVSVLTKQNDGTYKYQSVFKETPLKTQKLKISAQGARFKVDTATPGDYALSFRLQGGGLEILKVQYSITGEINLSQSLERNAELQIALNKKDFQPNEDIEMQIRAPYHGSGLITIERDGVYAAKWFKTTTNSTVATIKIPEGLAGNAYVNVAFIRALDSKEIFTSPLSYAIAPFSISLDQHKTNITLKVPEKVKPGQSLKINYSTNRPTSIILYGVDEGILQVAKYKTPDPLTYFFQKRALQVRTFQLLDLLLPEFSLIQQMQAAGGDEGFRAIGQNLNPFKARRLAPVVFWSGVLQSDSQAQTYTYNVPDYFNGNLKIMAVASSEGGLGSVDTSTIVRGDFILTPSTPVFVAPGDEFQVGVGISNQMEGSGANAAITAKVLLSEHLETVGAKNQNLTISEGHESQTAFKLKAKSVLGEASVDFVAEAKGKSAHFKSTLSVRSYMPYTNFFNSGLVEKFPLQFENAQTFHAEYSKMAVHFSSLPLVLSYGLIQYLDTYPYGCTEQVVSKAFPSLILRTRQEFLPNPEKVKDIFESAIQTLRTRQASNGGFALYSPAYESVNAMASLYAIHYLVEAKERNLDVPLEMLEKAKQYLRSETKGTQSISQIRHWAYANYLLARLGVVDGASVSDLHKILEKNFKEKWQEDSVALFLAGTYKLYKQDQVANGIMKNQKMGRSKVYDYENYQDTNVHDSHLLYMVARHFPEILTDLVSTENMKKFIEPLMKGQFNTHSSAWAILALDAIAKNALPNSLDSLKVEASVINDKNQEVFSPVVGDKKQNLSYSLPFFHKRVKVSGESKIPLFYLYSRSGFPDKAPTKEIKKGLELTRVYMDKDGKEVEKVKLGDELEVHLRVRTTDNQSRPHIAMVDLLPGGFELIINKPTENSGSGEMEGSEEGGSPEGGEGDGYPHGDEGEGSSEGDPGSEEGAYFWNYLFTPAYAQSENSVSLTRLSPEFVEEREDRVVIYATVHSDVNEYVYRIKAVNEGRYVVPPAFAESMYEKDIQFIGISKKIEVESAKK